MTTTERITSAECDHCCKTIRIRQDGTIGKHSYKQHGRDVECRLSGKNFAFHMGSFRIIERDGDGKGELWLCECRCGETKTAPGYEQMEQWHDEHSRAARTAEANARPRVGQVFEWMGARGTVDALGRGSVTLTFRQPHGATWTKRHPLPLPAGAKLIEDGAR